MYKIVLSKEVTKFLEKRNKKELKRILEKFDKLEINPYPSNSELDIKKLKNCEEYRLRIGKYRFIYQIKNNVLIIIMKKPTAEGIFTNKFPLKLNIPLIQKVMSNSS